MQPGGSASSGLVPYRLLAARQPIAERLGPPDFFPLTKGCPEDVLTPVTIQSGYKDAAHDVGVSEGNEHESAAVLFLQATAFAGGVPLAPAAATAAAAAAAAAATRIPPSAEDASSNMAELRKGVWDLIQRTLASKKLKGGQQGFSAADQATAASALPATATSATAEDAPLRKLPEPSHMSDDERVAWMHELAAGGHDLAYLAASLPAFSNRHMLFQALWHCQVPAPRAAWLIRILYSHWVLQQQQQQQLAAGGRAVPSPKAGEWGPHCQCSSQWTEHALEALEQQLEAQASQPSPPSWAMPAWPLWPDQSASAGLQRRSGHRSRRSIRGLLRPLRLVLGCHQRPCWQHRLCSWDEFGTSDPAPAAAVVLGDGDRCWLDGSARAKAAYLCRLAGHTFRNGMCAPGLLLDWAVQQLSGTHSCDDARVEAGLLLLSSCLQDLLANHLHARKLVEALIDFLATSSGSSPASTPFSGRLTTAVTAPLQQQQRLHALTLLEACATAAPSSLLALDCLPKLAAQATAIAAMGSTRQQGLSAVSGPKQLQRQHSHLQQQQTAGGRAMQVDGSVGSQEGASTSGRSSTTMPKGIQRVLARHAALTAAVSPRILTYSEAVALRELERARIAGDVEAGMRQLHACMGGDMRRVDQAVHLLCEFAVTSPLAPPPPSSRLCQPSKQANSPTAGSDRQPEQTGDGPHHRSSPSPSPPSLPSALPQLQPPEMSSTPHLLFTCLLLTKLHGKLSGYAVSWYQQQQQQQDASSQGPLPRQGRGCSSSGTYLLQDALFSWLDTREEILFPSGGNGGLTAGQRRAMQKQQCSRVMSLVLDLVEADLFCPKAYLRRLVADGVLQAARLASASQRAFDYAGRRAQRHLRYLQHFHPQLPLALSARRASLSEQVLSIKQPPIGSQTLALDAATLPATPPLPSWDIPQAAAQQPLAEAPSWANRNVTAAAPPQAARPLPTSAPAAGPSPEAGCPSTSWLVFAAARRVVLARCGLDQAAQPPQTTPAWPHRRGKRRAAGIDTAADGGAKKSPRSDLRPNAGLDPDPDVDLDLVPAVWAWLGAADCPQQQALPADPEGSRNGGASGNADGGQWLCQGVHFINSVQALRPWQRRVLGLAAMDAIACRFTAADLPAPPLRTWRAAQRQAVLNAEQALVSILHPDAASATNPPPGSGQAPGSSALSAMPSTAQPNAPQPAGGSGMPSQNYALSMPSPGDLGLSLVDDEDDAMLLSLLLDGTPGGAQQGQDQGPGAGMQSQPWENGSGSTVLSRQQSLQQLQQEAKQGTAGSGKPAMELLGGSALQRLSGGLWLQRSCALLDTCGVGDACASLLIHLTEGHVAAAAAAAEAASGSGGGDMPPPVTSPLTALQVPEGALLACIEAWKERIVSMGVLPQLLDTCTSWAFAQQQQQQQHPGYMPSHLSGHPYGHQAQQQQLNQPAVSPAAGREHCGRIMQMAGCLLACHLEAGPVKEWWAALQRADKQQGQHWLVGDLGAYTNLPACRDAMSSSQLTQGSGVIACPGFCSRNQVAKQGERLARVLTAQAPSAAPGGAATDGMQLPVMAVAGTKVAEAVALCMQLLSSQQGEVMEAGSHSAAQQSHRTGSAARPPSHEQAQAQALFAWCCGTPTAAVVRPGAVDGSCTGGPLDQERVVACVAALLLHAVQATLAAATAPSGSSTNARGSAGAGSGRGSTPGGDGCSMCPAVAARRPALACLEHLRCALLRRSFSADIAIQHALAASASALLMHLDSFASNAASAASHSRSTDGTDGPIAVVQASVLATLATLVSASCMGLLSWPDVVGCVLAALPAASSQLLLSRCAALGPLLLSSGDDAVGAQNPPSSRSVSPSGTARSLSPNSTAGALTTGRAGPSLASSLPLLDPGEAAMLQQWQLALPAQLVLDHALDPLLAAASHRPQHPHQSPGHSRAGGNGETASAVLCHLNRAIAGAMLAAHGPLRQCLLADPKALCVQLAAPAALTTATSAIEAYLPPGSSLPSLPALAVTQLIVSGHSAGSFGDHTAEASSQAPVLVQNYGLQAMTVMSGLATARLDLGWLLLRLMYAEQAYAALLGASNSGGGARPAPGAGAREAMEEVLTAAAAEAQGQQGGQQAAGNPAAAAPGVGAPGAPPAAGAPGGRGAVPGAAWRPGSGAPSGGEGVSPSATASMASEAALCDAILALLPLVPQRAPLLAEAAWQVGRPTGEQLLRGVDHVLRDRSITLGSRPLATALRQLPQQPAGSQRRRASSPAPSAPMPLTSAVTAVAGAAASPRPFQVEAALANIVLVGLTKSSAARQKEFAAETVRGLAILADALRRAPAPLSACEQAGTLAERGPRQHGEEQQGGEQGPDTSRKQKQRLPAPGNGPGTPKPSIAEPALDKGDTAGQGSDMEVDIAPGSGGMQPGAKSKPGPSGQGAPARKPPLGPGSMPHQLQESRSDASLMMVEEQGGLRRQGSVLQAAGTPGPMEDGDAGGCQPSGAVGIGADGDGAAAAQEPAAGPRSSGGGAHGEDGAAMGGAGAAASRKRNFAAFGSGRARRMGQGIGGAAPLAGAPVTAGGVGSAPSVRQPGDGGGGGGGGIGAATAAASSETAPAVAQTAAPGSGVPIAPAAVGGSIEAAVSDAEAVGSPAAVQVSVWMRLSMLLPLLPIIHADREPDPKRNLKAQLLPALLQLLLSPHLRPLAPLGTTELPSSVPAPHGGSASGISVAWQGRDPAVAAALHAQDAAGETLQERLAAVMAALLPGGWASWLRGNQAKKLRDVGAYEGGRVLQQELDAVMAAAAAAATAALSSTVCAAYASPADILASPSDVTGAIVSIGANATAAAFAAGAHAGGGTAASAAATCMTPYWRLQVQSLLPINHPPQAYAGLAFKPATAAVNVGTNRAAAVPAGLPTLVAGGTAAPDVVGAWTPLPLESLPEARQATCHGDTAGGAGSGVTGVLSRSAGLRIGTTQTADMMLQAGSSQDLLGEMIALLPRKRLKYQA